MEERKKKICHNCRQTLSSLSTLQAFKIGQKYMKTDFVEVAVLFQAQMTFIFESQNPVFQQEI